MLDRREIRRYSPSHPSGKRADDFVSDVGQLRAAQEYLGSEGGRLLMLRHTAGPAKLTEQVVQQQYTPENGIAGVEVLEAEPIRTQVVFEFGYGHQYPV